VKIELYLPRAQLRLRKVPSISAIMVYYIRQICRAFGNEGMLIGCAAMGKSDGFAVETPDLEDGSAALSLPRELTQRSNFLFSYDDVVDQEHRGDVFDVSSVGLSLKSAANIVKCEITPLIRIRRIVVITGPCPKQIRWDDCLPETQPH
jgi:hypothetical protein